MIGIDWGTTSLRAYRMDGHTVLERTELPLGITTIAPTRFGPALQQAVGAWLKHGDLRILLSGMIGSRQGWVEAPYLSCPAGLDDLAGSLAPVPWPGLQIMIVPGLSAADESGVPEVMRGEEVQILGTAGLDADCIVCLPGSHSKWVQMAGGRIAGFTTHLTGEAFAALREHTILAKMIADDAPHDADAFRRGVLRSGDPGGLLHHAFGVRSLGLFGQLDGPASYLSGLLIGHEIRAAASTGPVHLIGADILCARYADAIAICGGTATIAPPDAAARGLALIAERAPWT